MHLGWQGPDRAAPCWESGSDAPACCETCAAISDTLHGAAAAEQVRTVCSAALRGRSEGAAMTTRRNGEFRGTAAIFLVLPISTSHYPVSDTQGGVFDRAGPVGHPSPDPEVLLLNGAVLVLNSGALLPNCQALVVDGAALPTCRTGTDDPVLPLSVPPGRPPSPRFGLPPGFGSCSEPATERGADDEYCAFVTGLDVQSAYGQIASSQENIPATPQQSAAVALILHCDVQVTVTDRGTTLTTGAAHAARR